MPSFAIEEQDIVLDLTVQIGTAVWRIEIYFLPFELSPESLNIDVILCPSFAIHGYFYIIAFKYPDKYLGCKL